MNKKINKTTYHYKSQNSCKSNFCYNLLYMHLNMTPHMSQSNHRSNFFHMNLHILQRNPIHNPLGHLLQKHAISKVHVTKLLHPVRVIHLLLLS